MGKLDRRRVAPDNLGVVLSKMWYDRLLSSSRVCQQNIYNALGASDENHSNSLFMRIVMKNTSFKRENS